MDWSHFMAVLAGVVGTRVSIWIRGRLDRPYRWTCPEPGCYLRVAVSDKQGLQLVKEDHARTFHFSDLA